MGQLAAARYEIFLPMIAQRTSPGSRLPACRVPMFRSYLFVRHKIDKQAWLDISNTKGVVSILGARWDKLARIPDQEIGSIKLLMESRLPTMPYPWLEAGTPVRITRGPLMNARGVLVDSEIPNGLFVVSINLLQRSVAVKVNYADVEQV
jgi:transcription antitermination factor NusG